MSAPSMLLVCAGPGCAGKRCPRDHHAYLGGGPSGREPAYGRCLTHGKCTRFELDEPVAALEDSPAGADGVPGVAHRPGTNLPGTNPAPAPYGREASPVRGGEGEAAEAMTPVSAAGRLLGSHVTWWCPRELSGHDLPSAHTGCRTELIRARVTIREEPDVQ